MPKPSNVLLTHCVTNPPSTQWLKTSLFIISCCFGGQESGETLAKQLWLQGVPEYPPFVRTHRVVVSGPPEKVQGASELPASRAEAALPSLTWPGKARAIISGTFCRVQRVRAFQGGVVRYENTRQGIVG